MKRVISAFAVVAIVSSALAFAPKGLSFCASTIQNVGCFVVTQKTEERNTHQNAPYFKYSNWNGQAADCLSTRCETPTVLYNEN